MKAMDTGGGGCEKIRGYLDSYISNELLVETNHEVLKHLESCGECAQELEARTRTRSLLAGAVKRQAAPAGLEQRVRRAIRGERAPKPLVAPWAMWTAAAAMLVVTLGVWGSLRFLDFDRSRIAALLGIGHGDHVHCTLGGFFPEKPPAQEAMAEKLGEDYAALLPVVMEKAQGYRIRDGHRCRWQKRQFVHFVLERDRKLMSVILVKKNEGEDFPRHTLLAAMRASGLAVYETTMDKLEVAGFETRGHLGFVVSDEPKDVNLKMLADLAGPMRDALRRAEL